jgi:hypothetical protein
MSKIGCDATRKRALHQDARDRQFMQLGTVAAIVAAVASVLAVLIGLAAWLHPIQ